MALCINQSGTWRNITTQCVNESGVWRNINIGCIRESGTWRLFLPPPISRVPLGTDIEGGKLICRQSNVAWIVAPINSEVSRCFGLINDAVTCAQQVTGCTGWFVPNINQLQNPGYTCRSYWDYSLSTYWSTSTSGLTRFALTFTGDGTSWGTRSGCTFCVRAFRCVTY